MAAFLRRHAYRGGKTPTELLGRLRLAPTPPTGLPPQVLAQLIGAQIQLLRTLLDTIAQLETEIKRIVATHPRARLLQQLPGIGQINLAQILAEIGPILDRVNDAEQAAAECGATPVTKSSGKTTGVYFRWAANTRARGKRNPHATRIVARSWIRVIWACWHTNTPYDPHKHTAEQRTAATLT